MINVILNNQDWSEVIENLLLTQIDKDVLNNIKKQTNIYINLAVKTQTNDRGTTTARETFGGANPTMYTFKRLGSHIIQETKAIPIFI